MTGRFTDIPRRLRDVPTRLTKQLSDSEWLAISGLMEDAALKIEALEAERDEADRRAGEAERTKAEYVDSYVKRQSWLDDAKKAAGYHRNVSFDDVWAEALAALNEKRAAAQV